MKYTTIRSATPPTCDTSTPAAAEAFANATTSDNRMMPITSSMTAAPRIATPSRERSTPFHQGLG
jgi:hypothetical protein